MENHGKRLKLENMKERERERERERENVSQSLLCS